ncbi:hypothetical protein H0H93_006845, partial [Arthromyces matolae]
TDIPLTLKTTTPTDGLALPKLNPWTLSISSAAILPAPAPVAFTTNRYDGCSTFTSTCSWIFSSYEIRAGLGAQANVTSNF